MASLVVALAAIGLLAIGFGSAGGLLALVQQCFLVGLPLTMVLGEYVLRSNRTMVAMSFALSMAISALSAQLMIVFTLAEPMLLVAAATLYGIVIALAANSLPRRRSAQELLNEETPSDDGVNRWRDTRELALPRADRGSPVPVPPQLRPPEERTGS